MTFSVFVISKRRKTKKFNRAFDQYQYYFFGLKLKIQIHCIKNFIHSHLLLLNQQTWKYKRKCILYQFGNTLAEDFWDIRSKVGSLIKYLCCTKITFEWITHPFLDLPLPPTLCVTRPLILNFFSTPHYPVFWNVYTSPPFVTGGGGFKLWPWT